MNARRALVQSMADRQTNAVALIQSLGGGWQAERYTSQRLCSKQIDCVKYLS